jgi:phosphate transport system substrate-binding protein
LKKYLAILFGAILISSVVSFAGCIDVENTNANSNTNAGAEKSTIKISGSTTVLPIAKETAKKYMQKHPNVLIEVSGGGSGFGIKQVGEGLVDIGMASRDVKPAEMEKYSDLKVYNIGLDGVAIIVNPSNKVSALTKEQLKKIYAGEITNWKEVGGEDAPINVYTRDEESGTREVFHEKALDKGDITEKATVVQSNGAMKTAVAGDKNAIGFISIGYLDNSVKGVKFDGVEPTEENVKNGKYKVSRTLHMITKGEPTGAVKDYLDYVLSPEGQEVVKEKGYMPIN